MLASALHWSPAAGRPAGRRASQPLGQDRAIALHAAAGRDPRLTPGADAEGSASAAVRAALAGPSSSSAPASLLALGEAACLAGAAGLQALPVARRLVEGPRPVEARGRSLVGSLGGHGAQPPPPASPTAVDPAALGLLTLGAALGAVGRGLGRRSSGLGGAAAQPATLAARVGRLEAVAERTAAGAAAAAGAADKARLRSRLLARDVGPAVRAAQAEAAAASDAVAALAKALEAAQRDAADGRALLVGLQAAVAKQWAVVARLVPAASAPGKAAPASTPAKKLAFRRPAGGGGGGGGGEGAQPAPPPAAAEKAPAPAPPAPTQPPPPPPAVNGVDTDGSGADEVLYRFG